MSKAGYGLRATDASLLHGQGNLFAIPLVVVLYASVASLCFQVVDHSDMVEASTNLISYLKVSYVLRD